MLLQPAAHLPVTTTRTARCACLRAARRDIISGVTAVSWVLLQQHQAPAAAAAPLTEHLQRIQPGPLLDLQTDYDRYSSTYDNLDGGAASEALGFPQLRAQLLQQARGDVLEVAVGTGLNLPFYSWADVTSYTGIDLSPGMLGAAQARAQQLAAAGALPTAAAVSSAASSSSSSAAAVEEGGAAATATAGLGLQFEFNLQQADAAKLPFPDASFDTVTDTFSLCVIDRPLAALQEMRRVLRPGGQLLLLEHSRSDNPLLAGYQDLTEPLVTPLSKGCVWNQDLPQLLAAAGLRPVSFSRTLQGTISSIVAEAA